MSPEARDAPVTFAEGLADTARAFARQASIARAEVRKKADRSFVTELDERIEAVLRAQIETAFPEHGILGEEGGGVGLDRDFVWVIDPIDGTAAFTVGLPVWGTLIALCHLGRPVIGIVDLPAQDRRWVGATGRVTLENGEPCRTAPCDALAEAVVSVCNPDFFPPEKRPVLARLEAATAWRIYGAACTSYGLLASGRTDLHLDTGFKLHDLMALVPVIEGAGGLVSDWSGRPITLESGPDVLALGDPARLPEVLALIGA